MKRRGDGRVYKRKGSPQWYIQYSIRGVQHREAVGPSKAAARQRLRDRLNAARLPDWVPPSFERVLVADLLDALLLQARTLGQRSAKTLASHMRPLRAFFEGWKAAQVTSASMAQYQSERLAAGRKPGTVNHEAEALRRAFRSASRQTPPLFPPSKVPAFTMLPASPPRQGFFERAEVEALLRYVQDADLRDFIRWGWLTGMRKGEAAALTWAMLDTSSDPWLLRVPGEATKNGVARTLGLAGEARAVIERRVEARRMDCSLIFHRAVDGKRGRQPMRNFDKAWKGALRAASLPEGRLFHDLRRSAVRNLIRAGVDEATAMKVSGHKTRSMLLRYNIITGEETALALARTDAYLALQPMQRNVERAQFGDSRKAKP